MKRPSDGIHNRKEDAPFLPSESALRRAMRLRALASTFRAVADEIQDVAPERAKVLKHRAQLMRLKVAMILMGDDASEAED